MKFTVGIVFGIFLYCFSQAGVLSPSSIEMKFSYKAEFQTAQPGTNEELAAKHAQFLFGYLQSPEVVAYFKAPSETLGIATPKLPLNFMILSEKKSSGTRTISYKAEGTMLIQKKVASQVIAGGFEITLPANLDTFYDIQCTDKHYPSPLDFWYFYDPFRDGCEHLRETPLASNVVLTFKEFKQPSEDTSAGFKALRADNGNGDLFEIATVNGFSESSTSSKDDGRVNFEAINKWLRAQGFSECALAKYENRPVLEFTKTLTTKEGKEIHVRIVRLLAETEIISKNVTFAKFFKNALENSDVVIYSGHSGLGGNLYIPSLELKAGEITFNPKKRQLFFFDSCSSYSNDLTPFENKKTKGKIDILTQGLPSYFWAEVPTLEILFSHLFDVDQDPSWKDVLKSMEKVMAGQTQMLSVGPI